MQELQKREYTHFGNSDQENNQLRHLSLCYLFTQDVISIINLHHNCVSLISRIRFPRRRQKYLYYQIEPYGYGLRKNPLYAYEGQTPAVAERLQHQFITDRSVSQILLRKKCKQQMGQLTYLGNKRDRQYFQFLHTNMSATKTMHTFVRQFHRLLLQCLMKIYA